MTSRPQRQTLTRHALIWVRRMPALVAAALVATVVAGVTGGIVLFAGFWATHDGVTPATLLAFAFGGLIPGSAIAAPVTCLVLPGVQILCLLARLPGLIPLLVAGFVAGGLRIMASEGVEAGPLADGLGFMMALAGASGGLLGGWVFHRIWQGLADSPSPPLPVPRP